jgi:hypothetical protein
VKNSLTSIFSIPGKHFFTFGKLFYKSENLLGACILSYFSFLKICLKPSPKQMFTFVPKVKKCLGLDSQANFHFCKIAWSVVESASKCSPQAILQK